MTDTPQPLTDAELASLRAVDTGFWPEKPHLAWRFLATIAAKDARIAELDRIMREAQAVLAWYACPVGNDVDGSPIKVPDFYDELEFGESAAQLLPKIRTALIHPGEPT